MKQFLVLLILFSSFSVYAKNSETENLVKGCNELVGIYENHKEKRLVSSLIVSSSDSLLAGYCMGVTKSLTTLYSSCRGRNWYQLAERIANEWEIEEKNASFDRYLRRMCNG